MKYRIERTSSGFDNKKPCEEAYCDCLEHLADRSTEWYININTLEELKSLVNKYGSFVIDSDSIEIYDDYRE